MKNTIKLPQFPWQGQKELELTLPDKWHVETHNMAGYNRPAISDKDIKHVLTNLTGSAPISERAKNKKEIVIIFDDIVRVTRVYKILPFVLQELEAAGIKDSQIRFICASGTHSPMDRSQFALKLGEPVLARFPVYNHNPFYNCTYVGTTSRGTKVNINSEFMACDFKIAIGSITPHVFTVFSGGPKIILPGVSSLETIVHNHGLPADQAARADYVTNPIRLDMEEAAGFAGLDVNIEGILNLWGDTVELFAGELKQSHDKGVKAAVSNYSTPRAQNKDIVIANTYAKVGEATVGLRLAFPSVKAEGGDVVLICNTPMGQSHHYILGPCGNIINSMRSIKSSIPPNINRLIVFTEYPDIAGLGYIENSPKLMMLTKWDDVLRVLKQAHGDKAEVAVYPNSDIQRLQS
jgi:lactate racemase